MAEIASIPKQELVDDREASLADMAVCMLALAVGITHHKDGMPVCHRLDRNREIVKAIDAELERRRRAE